MKIRYEKPKAGWISFQAAEELMTDVAIGSRPGTGTGTEVPPSVNGKSEYQF